MVATVFMLFLTVSEQKSKVRLISEISEFSYLALGQIRKLGNLGKIFLSFRNFFNCLEILGKICVTISDDKNE